MVNQRTSHNDTANKGVTKALVQNMAIRHKLVAIIMFTCVLALVIAGLTFMTCQYFSTRQAMVKTLQTQATMIANNCEAAVTFEDAADAEEILSAFQAQSSVLFACIFDNNGNIFAKYQRDSHTISPNVTQVLSPEDYLFTPDFLIVSKPVIGSSDNKTIGRFSVWSDLTPIKAMFRRYLITICTIIIFASWVAYLISSRIQGIISGPILQLTDIAKTVSDQKEYSIRVQKLGNDEFGVLIDSFNGMLTQIQERDVALVSANEELETRVEKRTEKRKAQLALRESELRYKTLLQNIPQKVLYKDLNCRFMLCNDNFANDLNINSDDIYGKTDFDFFDESVAEKYVADDKRIMKAGVSEEIEELHIQNGKELTVQVQKSPVRDGDGNIIGIFCIFWDITAHKEAEKNQIKLNKDLKATVTELQRSNSELQDFAYVTAHDLKAPLRAIGTLTDWISGDYQDVFDDQGREHMELVKGRVSRMDGLIDSILRYGEIGRIKHEIKTIDLNDLLPEAIAFMDPPEHIKVEIITSLPTIAMERLYVLHIFQNLIDNAIKFMDKDKAFVQIRCEEEGNIWKFSIADNGPGIDAKYHEKIFKMFQTLVPRDELESTGIGLAFVKKIVELYGGQIWVDSKLGQGSTFRFTLSKELTSCSQKTIEAALSH